MAGGLHSERELLQAGLARLRDLLGDGWAVAPLLTEFSGTRGGRFDALVEVSSPGGEDGHSARLLAEVKTHITPKDVEQVLLPMRDAMRRVGSDSRLLVICPWVSPRAQQVLRDHGIGYLDMTGNAWLRLDRPAVVVRTDGAVRSPRPHSARSPKPQLAGAKAGRLVRLLADVRPPYRADPLAKASGLSLPYVSRLLDALEEQLLVRRDSRVVTEVDWPGILRLRAGQLSLLKSHTYVSAIAPSGPQQVVNRLRHQVAVAGREFAVTGTHAAHTVAPLAVGGQLMIYVPDSPGAAEQMIQETGLLPTDEGADVLLLRARDEVVFQRARTVDGVRYVALSQLALDCLSGPGRMPAEGEAVVSYMAGNESEWRVGSLEEVRPGGSPE
ncbi:hypothetical protein GCM10009716_45120 [Streptomyces sodiiphilus]|uniref:HTH iclR-type domain-containing protein n=1 Tax=Streptomyces sodiiphilus TaxID=226217 RepID=A0ABN2PVQ6_9ACTN